LISEVPTNKGFDLNRSDWSKWILLILVLLSLGATLYVQYPLLEDTYAIGDDWRHLYWMMGFQDPEVFPDDYLLNGNRFYTIHLGGTRLITEGVAPGYGLLFYLASFLVDPILFGKILPFILMPIYVVFLFKIGQRLKNNTCGLLLGLLGIVFGLGYPGEIRTGYQRSFAFPLTAMFLYYAIKNSSVGVTLSLVLQGLFYLPTLLVSVPAYILSQVRYEGKLRVSLSRKTIAPVLAAMLVAAIVFFPAIIVTRSGAGMATQESTNQKHVGLLDNPAYGIKGRDAVFAPNRIFGIPLYLIVGFAGLISNYGVAANLAPLLLLCGLILLVVGGKSLRLGRQVWSLFLAGLLLFVVAWVIGFLMGAFALNMPNKYVKVTIPLMTAIFVAVNLEDFITGWVTPRWKRVILCALLIGSGAMMFLVADYFSPANMASRVSADGEITAGNADNLARLQVRVVAIGIVSVLLGAGRLILAAFKQLDRQRVLVCAQPIGILLFTLLAIGLFFPGLKPARIVILQEERDILEFIATLPKDVLIAGVPEVMSNIPVFAQRRVLFSSEKPGTDTQAIIESFDAYYAESGQEVLDFCSEYGIDYWIVDAEQFEEPFLSEQRFFFDPFNDKIIERIQGRQDFILPRIPEQARLFQAGEFFVVACDADAFEGLLRH
jgi:hypothetical protein